MRNITLDASFSHSPAKVFSLLFDLGFLSAATGAKARIRQEEGTKYRVGGCTGKVLHLEKNKLLVRTMRLGSWAGSDGDAVSVFRLEKTAAGADLSVTIAGLPDSEVEAVKKMIGSSLGAMKDHLAQPLAKSAPKRRGRPPKAETASRKLGAPAKRRGRPPKAKSPVKSDLKPAPKRRGRPPKAAKVVAASPKRRGRPPKSAAASATPTLAKRRGRPPKTGVTTKALRSPRSA